MSRSLRPRVRVSYCEPEEPELDEYVFCEECGDFVYEYCSIHGPLLVIPDDKVPAAPRFPPSVPRAALTIPHVFLHLNYSSIPGAGVGVFTTLTLPKGVRFGPYRGVNKTTCVNSDYSWQIYGPGRKPSNVVDASDGSRSNWMRFVNCARRWPEQNLLAFQYQGQLYYRTIKIIPRFTELLVFYGSEFANKLNIDLAKYNAPKCYAQKFGAPPPKKTKVNVEKQDGAQPVIQQNTGNGKKVIKTQKKTQKSQKHNVEVENDVPVTKKRRTEPEKSLLGRLDITKQELNKLDKKSNVDDKHKTSKENTEPNSDSHVAKNIQNDAKYLCTDNKNSYNKNVPPNKEQQKVKPKDVYLNCDVCKYQTVVKYTLEKHMRLHDVNRKFSCETCGYRYCKNYDLIQHKQIHGASSDKAHKCHICDYVTVKQNDLKKHLRTHTGEKPYTCNVCDYKCNREGHLKIHLRTHTGEKPYTCNVCDYKCNHAGSLKRHLRTHTGEKPFTCNVCDYKSNDAGNLKIHLRTHTGEKPYTCNVCDYKCKVAGSLKQHLRTHTGDKPYTCNVCDYKCNQAGHLKQHLKTHTGEKPFTCNVCDYKCKVAGYLKIHLRTHTGEKPYTCNVCDYKCKVAGYLKIHLRTHTGEKPYTCNVCDYKCNQAGNLKQHLRTHTGEKPYSCDICEFRCSHSETLTLHLKRKHLQ